jgi:RNA polymerase-binding protein DksA
LRKKPVSIQERHISVAKKTSKKKASPKKPAATKKKLAKKTTVRKKVSKKVAAKKTGTMKVLKRRRKRTLTAKEIQHFKELLLQKRTELIGDVSSIENETLKKSRLDAAGDLSSMPIHMADLGTDNFEQEFALGLMDSERKILAEINDALGRIGEGVYGICEGTGKPIAKARLEANPWARYCIKYATMVEQGLIKEGEKIAAESEEEYEVDDELDQIEDLEEGDEGAEFDDEE